MNNRKRGRPKKSRPEKDYGTEELQNKRFYHLTDEVLDLCLSKEVITEQMHKAGLHLRWLHSIRFGITSLTVDITFIRGHTIRNEDGSWREAREKEYNTAIDMLSKVRCQEEVLSACVYNKMPRFMFSRNIKCAAQNYYTYTKLCEGLQLLARLWFSTNSNKFSTLH